MVKEGNKSRDGMMNRSGVGQVAAGRLEDGIWAAKTEWWGKQGGDWLCGCGRWKVDRQTFLYCRDG